MTIAIGIKVQDGIVLCADSTFSRSEKGVVFHGGQKIFHPGNLDESPGKSRRFGFATYGNVLLNGHSYRELSARLENWITGQWHGKRAVSIPLFAQEAKRIITDVFKVNLKTLAGGILFAGYDDGAYQPRIFTLTFASGTIREEDAGKPQGICYNGQPTAVNRMVHGIDPQALIVYGSILFQQLHSFLTKSKEATVKMSLEKKLKFLLLTALKETRKHPSLSEIDLPSDWIPPEITAEWELESKTYKPNQLLDTIGLTPDLPIREVANMAYHLVDSSIELAHFTGETQTIGGKIETAAITPERGFRWVCHKRLDDCL